MSNIETEWGRKGWKKQEHRLGGTCRNPVSGHDGPDKEGSRRGSGTCLSSGYILEDGTNRIC